MDKKGYVQGDMKADVNDYQKPSSNYSQEGFGKTTEYIPRQNQFVNKEAGKVRSQSYKGRYS